MSDTGEMLRQAVHHHRAGRVQDAERLYRRILRREPRHPQALNFLGVLARRAGHLDAAAELIGKSIEARPDYAEAHVNLGNVLKDRGDLEAAVASYRHAVEARPGYAEALSLLGAALIESGRLDEAVEACRQALSFSPDLADAHFNLANALQEKGELQPAVASYRRVLSLRPTYGGAHANLAAAYLKLGRAEEALRTLDEKLAGEPQNVRALAYKCLALNELGRKAELRRLVDFGRLVGRLRLSPPEGFGDLGAFNRRLAEEIRHHPTLTAVWNPAKRAARGGSVTADMLVRPTPFLQDFEKSLRRAIDAWSASLGDDPSHPFLMKRPRSYRLILWGNILEEEGHQAAHIHNLGWLSGVYYVDIPPSVRADDPEKAGWIEFGRPGYGLPCLAEPEVATVRPEEGMLLLFPSYVWHRTVPIEGAAERISVAFDLIPG